MADASGHVFGAAIQETGARTKTSIQCSSAATEENEDRNTTRLLVHGSTLCHADSSYVPMKEFKLSVDGLIEEKVKEKMKDYQHQLDEMAKKWDETTGKLQDVTRQLKEVTRQLEEVTKEKTEITRERDEALEKVKSLEMEKSMLEEMIKSLQSEVQKLKEQMEQYLVKSNNEPPQQSPPLEQFGDPIDDMPALLKTLNVTVEMITQRCSQTSQDAMSVIHKKVADLKQADLKQEYKNGNDSNGLQPQQQQQQHNNEENNRSP